jgi:hypothetical protein
MTRRVIHSNTEHHLIADEITSVWYDANER